jgi:dinuclear metal center YbgI/SA1388 family protein
MQDAPKHPTVGDIARAMERWAPPFLQESYDNAGLLVGRADAPVQRVVVGLDCNEALIEEAVDFKGQMVVVHHPVIFQGLKRLTGQNTVQRTVELALRHGIAIYAAHTNLDHVSDGVNAALAERLGLVPATLRPLEGKPDLMVQLVVFVPEDAADGVEAALFDAGAGKLGRYDRCGFQSNGTGSFRPLTGARPALGTPGDFNRVEEVRLEALVHRWDLPAVLEAMRATHPYEEIAHQILPLANAHPHIGSGRVGELPTAMPVEAFLDHVKQVLGCGAIRHSALVKSTVQKVALCGGSGAFLTPAALRWNADVYVTSDLKYHEFDAAQNRLVLVDVGHYESEWPVVPWIQERLMSEFRDIFPNFAVRLAQNQPNPVHYR